MEIDPFENSTEDLACEVNQERVLAEVASGELTSIDGIASPNSLMLVSRLGATTFDMNSWWVKTPQDWVCPACGRDKSDIARLNTKGEIMCHLVEHHDHMKDVLKRRFQELSVIRETIVADERAESFAKRSATMISAYENTIICVDCNNADASAKKAAEVCRDFSFSPQELRRIIKSLPNRAHEVDVAIATDVWFHQQTTFSLRMKIANQIAKIAANNEHWFQRGDFGSCPDTINRSASQIVSSRAAFGVLAKLAGPKKKNPVKPLASWRATTHSRPKIAPTQNEIEHAGQVGSPRLWSEIGDKWQCPACRRNRREIVRRNNDGEWFFPISSRRFYCPTSRWKREEIVTCGDCAKVAEELGKEAAGIAGITVQGYTAQVLIDEVKRCVVVRSHVRHNVNNDEAEMVLNGIVKRIRHCVHAD